jgi:hypothetical protein
MRTRNLVMTSPLTVRIRTSIVSTFPHLAWCVWFFYETGGVTPLLIIILYKSYNNRVQTIKKKKEKKKIKMRITRWSLSIKTYEVS